MALGVNQLVVLVNNPWPSMLLFHWSMFSSWGTLSEETPQPTVYHHLSQVSVDMQLSGLI